MLERIVTFVPPGRTVAGVVSEKFTLVVERMRSALAGFTDMDVETTSLLWLESVMVTENANVPALVGVPASSEPLKVRPGGKPPEVMAKV